jgi:hypothetical protein
MAWYADLSPCDYFGPDSACFLRAVGWLERGKAFSSGSVDAKVYARLVELLKEPWEPIATMGFHDCDLCLYEGQSGKRNLFVPAGSMVFVCPELLIHYMNAHQYRPPEEFCEAVLTCPPMRSTPYFKALLASGARRLLHADRDASTPQ